MDLTSSRVVVERYLDLVGTDERRNAGDILRKLSSRALKSARTLPKDIGSYVRGTITVPLMALANFARGSRRGFREVMMESSQEQSIFESLGYLLSSDFLSKLTARSAFEIRTWLSSLAATLAFSADSQLWALDKGLLKFVAAIYEASPLRDLKNTSQRNGCDPVIRCNAVLLHLLQTEATAERVPAHNALSGFRPHKRKINFAEKIPPWSYIEARLQGLPAHLPGLPSAAEWKVRGEKNTGSLGVPVVCSWKMCTAEPEPVIGKKFGKCSLCQVARYCR